MVITISNQQKSLPLSLPLLRKRLKQMLRQLKCPSKTELSLLITTDEAIAQLNHAYLGHEGPTNVLSFSQVEGGGFNNGLLGDVVVSADTAIKEARQHGLDEMEHFTRLVLHGCLHLLGYHHEQGGEDARIMEELTEQVLASTRPEV